VLGRDALVDHRRLAFVLSVNKMPSGSTELPRQSEILSGITFRAQKPSGD
jgi:hypothetical protein